ncbi:16S rRNA methyltransferase GidB [Companilactobacillus paralimentarius DSM 13238 = JCM 10415]|jgi:16S rRNA (guanine(527)-N(7))-methyltransferase GidB|uniref:Ribosomal RNA small subunit methyltransferase G n=1 Tax=Companilactobacillus paralimentarius DSM 13238 = JCM 10415 TaxID=1122151 RepID=A0A0R1PJB0_9LACO|nr:16S rRNA (guanine(527)-N(7))-methyltransferase RsmG [Companilactobacillus paralimentarius]KAE9563877.1 16S rRNA (guanine(527)-N(7))-methyltransferase RsmG [Companilactobacillus paralimentarius]KRL32381.1 16S rRNA methyltransferase GidB [Companilactobacillus paralimentarius DSM 13238 = JCM 10415]MDR4932827.1 16S rRNA (guanine(527)-N(7))-methyltransferase RsmG [Companilactobacillus paralimentarius]
MKPEEFFEALAQKGIELSDVQKEQFATYFHELVETNKVMNLTSITDEDQVYLKHFYDSIVLGFVDEKILNEELTLCDVGSGAGFPSLPLKIINPKLKITIVDSLNKRIKFLEGLVNELNLTDVSLVHGRAEEVGKNPQFREKFDVVTARAVAAMNVLTEFCLPLVKVGGQFVAMKSEKAPEEVKNAQYAIETLGGTIKQQESVELPNDAGIRNFIFVEKISKTPKKYPRKPGTPAKKPLVK